MSVHPIHAPSSQDAIAQARVHLAAAHRLAALHELEEGIDNHFTVTLPGHEDRFLILPFGRHWSEALASDRKYSANPSCYLHRSVAKFLRSG